MQFEPGYSGKLYCIKNFYSIVDKENFLSELEYKLEDFVDMTFESKITVSLRYVALIYLIPIMLLSISFHFLIYIFTHDVILIFEKNKVYNCYVKGKRVDGQYNYIKFLVIYSDDHTKTFNINKIKRINRHFADSKRYRMLKLKSINEKKSILY